MNLKEIRFPIEIKSVNHARSYILQKAYTNDLNSIKIIFELLDCTPEDLTGATASIMLYMRDGSFFQDSATITDNTVTYILTESQGNHAGVAQAQIIVKKTGTEWASSKEKFEIVSGLETAVATEVMIKDWTTLTAEARAFIDAMEAAEAARQQAEQGRVVQLIDMAERIDNLVTTPVPVGEIIAEEIIDARAGKDSLGQKIRSVDDQLAQKELQEVGLPAELLVENPINPSQKLEVFLNNSSGKKVKFPYGKTFNLERPLAVFDVNNMEIDFNNCLFMLPDGYTATTRYEGNTVIGNYVLSFFNSPDITIKSGRVDGKRHHYLGQDETPNRWQTGLHVDNCDNFKCFDFEGKEINYHAISVYKGNNVFFDRLNFYNNGLAGGSAGFSDIYTWDDDVYSSMTFLNIHSERTDSMNENTGQILYINSSHTIVENVTGKNVAVPFDFRKGTHSINNVFIDGARALSVSAYPDSVDLPTIFAKNIDIINITGNPNSGSALMHVIACEKMVIENLRLESSSNSTVLAGLNIVNNAGGAPVNGVGNIIINNLEIKMSVANSRLIRTTSLEKNVYLRNVNLVSGGSSHNAVRTEAGNADVIVENVEILGDFVVPFESVGNRLKIKNQPIFGTAPPNTKPFYIGQEYLDTTNKKKYIAYGVNAISDWVVNS